MAWAIEWSDQALKALRTLDRPQARRLRDFLSERVATADHPRHLGEPLTGPLGGLWRYRVGDYRLLCRLEDARLIVLVVAVGHRRDIYR